MSLHRSRNFNRCNKRNAAFLIRPLGLSDLDEYIRLRREGVLLDPIGFGKAYTTEDKAPRSLYASFLSPSETRTIWGAFSGECLIGMVRLQTEENGIHQTIYSLYVCPEVRRQGLGRRLLNVAIRKAVNTPRVVELGLSVITNNEGALLLYRSAGFSECGTEENTFCVGGKIYSEYRMRRVLTNERDVTHQNGVERF